MMKRRTSTSNEIYKQESPKTTETTKLIHTNEPNRQFNTHDHSKRVLWLGQLLLV